VPRIADYRVIEIADLDIDMAVGIGEGTGRTSVYFRGHKHAQSPPRSGTAKAPRSAGKTT
jgi:hypothetical protein